MKKKKAAAAKPARPRRRSDDLDDLVNGIAEHLMLLPGCKTPQDTMKVFGCIVRFSAELVKRSPATMVQLLDQADRFLEALGEVMPSIEKVISKFEGVA